MSWVGFLAGEVRRVRRSASSPFWVKVMQSIGQMSTQASHSMHSLSANTVCTSQLRHLCASLNPVIGSKPSSTSTLMFFRVIFWSFQGTLKNIKVEVELGFDPMTGFKEAQRCLNCDVQTVFADKLCIECDACVDICPMDCITFTQNGEESDLRTRLTAPARNPTQDLYVSGALKTGRIMAKDEDVCLHCGLCAERCPTGAWDMQKFLLDLTHAGHGCRTPQKKAA